MSSSPVVFAFGSRSVSDPSLVADALSRLVSADIKDLWSGGASGADDLAATWARSHGLRVTEWLADWARLGRAAGAQRSITLLAALPAGSLCVCFAPAGCRFPGREAVVAAGGARTFLSAGSRIGAGACLASSFPLWLVWACGSMSRLVPSPGPRPTGWYPQSQGERLDAVDTSEVYIGEYGWDTTTHTPPAKPQGGWRSATIEQQDWLDRMHDEARARAHGDHERRSRHLGQTRTVFEIGHENQCRSCGIEIVYGYDTCQICDERLDT